MDLNTPMAARVSVSPCASCTSAGEIPHLNGAAALAFVFSRKSPAPVT